MQFSFVYFWFIYTFGCVDGCICGFLFLFFNLGAWVLISYVLFCFWTHSLVKGIKKDIYDVVVVICRHFLPHEYMYELKRNGFDEIILNALLQR